MPTQTINLNDALPAAPYGTSNVKWQGDPPSLDPSVIRKVSAYYAQQMSIGFGVVTGLPATTLTPPGRLTAIRAGNLSKCKITVNAADPLVALTFRIMKNGVNIFTSNPTLAGGTAGGTVLDFTNLTSSPLAVAENDKFTIDITAGAALWNFTAVLC